MKKSTIVSISEKTGFSPTTVSRVLNNKAKKYRISEKTISIIKDEAEKANYIPSQIAQSLRSRKTSTIGLIVPSIDNPFFSNIASIIVKKAKENGYTIILADTFEDEENEEEYLKALLSRNIDGIILVPSGSSPNKAESIEKNDTPVVLVDRYYNNTILPYISTDNYFGAKKAIEYLTSKGHQNIATIKGKPDATPTIQRISGYTDAMTKAGLKSYISISGNDFSIENGYRQTINLLNKKDRPTAIFAQSNTIALGVYKAIKEKGLQIPNDVSIIGFDNYHFLDFLEPPMTRIAQPVEEIAILAVETLINRINGNHKINIQKLLEPILIKAHSVKDIMSSH